MSRRRSLEKTFGPINGKKHDMKISIEPIAVYVVVSCAQSERASMKASIAAKMTTQAMELRTSAMRFFQITAVSTGPVSRSLNGAGARRNMTNVLARWPRTRCCRAAFFEDAAIDASSNETFSPAAMKKNPTPSARTMGREIASVATEGGIAADAIRWGIKRIARISGL